MRAGCLAFSALNGREKGMPGRPKGRPLEESHRENIRRARQWVRLFAPIKEAADAGNEREAVRLLRQYMRSKREEAA